MDILIFKLSALGDVLRTTSLLPALLAKHPGARITWVTAEAALPLLEGNPHLVRVLAWKEASARELAGKSFDLVLSLEEDEDVARFVVSSLRPREVIGVVWTGRAVSYTLSSAPYYDMSLLNPDPDGGHQKADALKKANRKTYVRLWTEILGLPELPPAQMRPLLALSTADREAAESILRELGVRQPIVGLNSSAGERWPAKRLSVPRAAGLARALADRFGTPVLLLGGPDEAQRNREIAAAAGPAAVEAGTGHSLKAFAALVERCDVVITTDSLAFHVANAMGRPAVVFVGPTSAAELDLFGPGVRLTPPVECADFYQPRCTQETSCVDRIPDAAFAAAVDELRKS